MSEAANVKVRKIIERKKRDDPTGLLRAQQDGKILQYLKKDLIAEGIDPDAVVIDSNPQKSKEPLEQSLGDYFDILSDHLDAEAYGPFYDANSGSFEKSLGEKITDYKTFRKINNSLKSLKVAAFLGSIFCALYSISQFMIRRPLKGAIYGLMAYDLVRVSYNCYIKKYCSITAYKLGGDFSKLGSTIFQVAQSALGLGGEDPLEKMRRGVIWENILDGTLTSLAIEKLKAIWNQQK